MKKERKRLPSWFKVPLGAGDHYREVRRALASQGLHTVCSSAKCPNLGECWNSGTATFMILGDVCTRDCGFCAVTSGSPDDLDTGEHHRLKKAVDKLGLKYVVVTSVTRDDLEDGGASVFVDVIRTLKSSRAETKVEVLIPDFNGNTDALKKVLDANPDVLNHNVETVPELYFRVRPQADYARSLKLLQTASQQLGEARTKSGLMVGLGESPHQICNVMTDLRAAGVGRLTIGQYLQPTKTHLPVERYIPPEEFKEYESKAVKMGFRFVASGPLVRSSYHAAEMQEKIND